MKSPLEAPKNWWDTWLPFGWLVILIGLLSAFKIIDHDIWFQLKGGELFLQDPRFPFIDVFSYVTGGREWVNQEWIAEILLYLTYKFSGIPGLIILKQIFVAASFALLYKFLLDRKANGWVVFWILFLTILLTRFRMNVRPHIFSDLFMIILLMMLDRHRRVGGKIIYWAPLLMFVWTNIHFGSLIGLYLMGVYLTGYLIVFCIPPFLKKETEALAKSKFFHLTFVIFLSAAAMMANPVGKELFEFFSQNVMLSFKFRVLEMSPTLAMPLSYFPLYWTTLAIYSLILLFNIRKADLFDVLLFLFGVALSQFMMRFIPYFAIFAAPVIADVLSKSMADGKGVLAKLRGVSHPALAIGLTLIISLWSIKQGNDTAQLSFGYGIHEKHPFAAIQFMEEQHIDGNVFNDMLYGGQILFKRHPKNKIFLYGRYTLADVQTADEYHQILAGEPMWREWFTRYNVDIVFLGTLLAQRSPFIMEISRASDWRLIYTDGQAYIFVRDIPRFKELIERYQYGLTVSQ